MELSNNFAEMGSSALLCIDGGTIWGVVSGIGQCIMGVSAFIGGATLIANPTVPGFSQFAGGCTCVFGACSVYSGVNTIIRNW